MRLLKLSAILAALSLSVGSLTGCGAELDEDPAFAEEGDEFGLDDDDDEVVGTAADELKAAPSCVKMTNQRSYKSWGFKRTDYTVKNTCKDAHVVTINVAWRRNPQCQLVQAGRIHTFTAKNWGNTRGVASCRVK
jgi:hypothetical protein